MNHTGMGGTEKGDLENTSEKATKNHRGQEERRLGDWKKMSKSVFSNHSDTSNSCNGVVNGVLSKICNFQSATHMDPGIRNI